MYFCDRHQAEISKAHKILNRADLKYASKINDKNKRKARKQILQYERED